jgi:hypothetical protein
MATNEHTSTPIAQEAARILAMSDAEIMTLALAHPKIIRAIAASALTQAPNRDDREG